jgi:hypothetical protein
MFDLCLHGIEVFSRCEDISNGVSPSTSANALLCCLTVLRNCVGYAGGTNEKQKLRQHADAVAFCAESENSLDNAPDLGLTSGLYASSVLCVVFGRDEGGSEFTFGQQLIDSVIMRMWDLLQGTGLGS